MTFISPAFLWALAAVSVPLLLHLVRRRKIRVIQWAAWQFLLQSQQRLKRRLRLEQVILAAIRAIIIALIVLAFARPVVRSRAAAPSAGSAPIHAVIALDNSASMAFERSGMTDFDRARKAADQIIARTLKQGDSVSVTLISSSPQPLVKHPSHDLEGVRSAIRSTRTSGLATDYARAARACLDIFEAGRVTRREVYVITDSQRSGFGKTPDARQAAVWRSLARMARVTWIHVAADNRPNASLLPPVLSRDFVTPGAPVRIEAEVVNRTESPFTSAAARLEVAGRTAGATSLQIGRGRSSRAAFTHTFDRSGTHYGRIVLDRPDGLVSDNSGWFAVRVRKALRVLIIGPTASGATPPDTLYLGTALSPAGASEGGTSSVTATIRNSLAGTAVPLRSFDVVALAGPLTISASEAAALRAFVESGGGLLAYPAASGMAGLGAIVGDRDGAIWPIRAAGRRLTALDQAASLDPASVAHPALSMFRASDATDLGAAKFTTTYEFVVHRPAAAQTSSTRTILGFSDGRPAMIERMLGEGRAILCAFPAGVDGGDLPLKAAYVPLIHQLVAYLASGNAEPRMVGVGRSPTLRFGIEAGMRPFTLTRKAESADDRDRLITDSLQGVPGADSVLLRCPPAAEPGVYEVRTGGSASGLSDAFAANLDPRETDLTVARPDLITAHAGSIPITFAREGDDLGRVVRASRHGSELWPALIMAALGLMAVETYLARAFGRRT